jgi:hydrogenase maturation protease
LACFASWREYILFPCLPKAQNLHRRWRRPKPLLVSNGSITAQEAITLQAEATPSTQYESRTLVLGLGNTLLQDEGIGVHVIGELARQGSDTPWVEFMDGGTLSFTLADPIGAAAALIVVDTAQLDSAPGTIRIFEGEEMDAFVGSGRKTSVHEVSLRDLLAIASLEGRLPARRALVGIQPRVMDWGHAPSPAVAAAIPRACAQVRALLERWAP